MRHAAPLTIDDLKAPSHARSLVRIAREKTTEGMNFSEEALQCLIDLSPHSLPIEEIEPAFTDLRSVCRELPLRCSDRIGFVDNLLISPSGRICLVECKLWQNGEAERVIVAQLLDYASALARLDYDGLVQQIRRVCREGDDPLVGRVLGAEADEDHRLTLIRGIERSLKLGNFLLLIVGDRIRPGIERMTAMLQDRATLGFSFGLIEMAIYRDANGSGPFYIQPRVLLRTEIVTRTVFVGEAPGTGSALSKVGAPSKPASLTEQEFFIALASVNPAYPEEARGLLERCRAIGCETELMRKYVIYVDNGHGGTINVGSIVRDGTVTIWGTAAHDETLGQPVGRKYMERVAALFPGGRVKTDGGPGSWHVRVNDRIGIPLSLLIEKVDAWLDLILWVQAQIQNHESIQADKVVRQTDRFVWKDDDVEITKAV